MPPIAKSKDYSTLRLSNGAVLGIGAEPPCRAPRMKQFFDVLVLSAREAQHRGCSYQGITVIRMPIPDGELTPTQRAAVRRTAKAVAASLQARQRVLVTCRMGLNRSALIASLALVEIGVPRKRAINTVRAMRSGIYPFPFDKALQNKHFTRMVEGDEA